MINLSLKKEIIIQIYRKFGLFPSTLKYNNIIEQLTSKEYLIDKTINFESDDKKYQNKIWAATVNLDNNGIFKVIIADLTEDVKEYAILIQLDEFLPYAIRLSNDDGDYGSCYFRAEDKWINASTLFQAKLLVAVESLSELIPKWEKLKDYNNIYQLLVGFLKFENEE